MADKNINIKINVSVAGIQKQLAKANNSLKRLGRSADTTNSQLKRMGGGMRMNVSSLAKLSGGFLALQSAFRVMSFGVRQMIEFEKTMSAVKAVSGATEGQFASLTEKARSLGATTAFSATEAAEGLKFLSMAGFSAQESMVSLESTLQLAQAGAMDLGRTADILSNIMRAMNMEASRTGEAGDIIAQAARNSNTSIEQLGDAFKYAGGIAGNLGLTLEETTAALSTLSNAGMQASMAGTGLRQVLTKLVNPSKSMREVFSSVGIKVDELDLSADNLVPTLRKLADAGLTTGEIFKAFEARAGTAFSVLTAGVADLESLERKNKSANGTLDEMATIMEDNLSTSIKLLQSAFSELMISQEGLGSAMSDGVKTLTAFVQILDGSAQSMDKNGNSTKKYVVLAEKGIIVMKALAVAFVAVKGASISASLIATARSMGILGTTTTATTGALIQQQTVVNRGFLITMLSQIKTAISGMALFKGAILGSTIALRTMAVAIASTGIGALVVGIGFVIGKLMDWHAQSEATKSQVIGDTKAVADKLGLVSKAYQTLNQDAKDYANGEKTRTGRGSKLIMEQLKGLKGLQQLQKQKPEGEKENKITGLETLETEDQRIESMKALNDEYHKLQNAQRATEVGSEQAMEIQKQIALVKDLYAIYRVKGQEIIKIRQIEKSRNEVFDVMNKKMTTNLRSLESFNNELRKTENAELNAHINIKDAEARFRTELNEITSNVADLAGRTGGSKMVTAIQNELANADIGSTATIAGMLNVGVETGEIEGMRGATELFEENVKRTESELLALAGGAKNATAETKKAITQMAILKEIDKSDAGGDSVFGFIRGEIRDTNLSIEEFKQRIGKLKEIEDLQATILFQNETDNGLAKLEGDIAKARLELMSLNSEFEHASKVSNSLAGVGQTMASTLNGLNIDKGEDTTRITSFDVGNLTQYEDFIDREDGLTKQRIAQAIRGISVIEKLQMTRKALLSDKDSTGRDKTDTKSGKLSGGGEALLNSLKNNSAEAEDIIAFAVANGFAKSKDDFLKVFNDAGTTNDEREKMFQALADKAEVIRNSTIQQGVAQDEITKKTFDLLDLESSRAQTIKEQTEQLKAQGRILAGFKKQGDIEMMEANLALGAGGVTQADIDLEKQILEGEKSLATFGKKLRKTIDEATEVEIALKRTELSSDKELSSVEKETKLAEFKASVDAKNNAIYGNLISRQERIFNQTKFADQIQKALDSFGQEMKNFESKRKDQQDLVGGLLEGAGIIAKEGEKDADDKGNTEAGVSSLARVGGGGGVGRGMETPEDKQDQLVNLNKAMLDALQEIAKDKFGKDFKDLKEEDQEKLQQGAVRIQELVKQKAEGGIGLDAEEGNNALKNMVAVLAQKEKDDRLKEISNFKKVGALEIQEIENKAPIIMGGDGSDANAQVGKLIKDFKNLTADQQVLGIKKLQQDDAPPELIKALKLEASKGQGFDQAQDQKRFNDLNDRGDFQFGKEEQSNRADELFKNLTESKDGFTKDDLRGVFSGMVGIMDKGAERLADKLEREFPDMDSQGLLKEARVDRAVNDAKGSDMALEIPPLEMQRMPELPIDPFEANGDLPDLGRLPPMPDDPFAPMPDIGNIPDFPPLPNMFDMGGEEGAKGAGNDFSGKEPKTKEEEFIKANPMLKDVPPPPSLFEPKPMGNEQGMPAPIKAPNPADFGFTLPPPPPSFTQGESATDLTSQMREGMKKEVITGDDRINETNRLLKVIAQGVNRNDTRSSVRENLQGYEL